MVSEIDDVQLKVLVLESLRAQRDYLKFLRRVGRRHGLEKSFNDDETIEGNMIMERVSETIDRLSVVIDNCDTLTLSADQKIPRHTSNRPILESKATKETITQAMSRKATPRGGKIAVPQTQQLLCRGFV